jgi:type III restriction enzyme
MTKPLNQLVTTGQNVLLEPEPFQAKLITNMTHALLRPNQPPCLLRAPTGSGKTFILARVLANVSAEMGVVWFWFVPFVNLVAQTQDALASNAVDLSPMLLAHGRNQEAMAGQVLISTVQGVAKAQARTKGYNADGDDDTRTIAEFIKRARAQGLRIGMIVDEAHIALAKTTEFGKFAQWLNPDFMIMATATPKDQRLEEFLANAGKGGREVFAVSRDDVVSARLNKKYIEAIIYDLRQSVQGVADLQRTVLRQAWLRNQKLKRELANAGIALTPLLLVQVANGPKTVEEAEQDLIKLCKVPPSAIGKHSSDDPDPVLMAAIANDASKEVLIFKQSAGTGFDAPRAFILASTKLVNDPDFAMQFIGRVMRVSHPIRNTFTRDQAIPASLDTAYIYLANAETQRGFEQAVQAAAQIKSQLEGQTEKMMVRQTISGATVITNKSSDQYPLIYATPVPLPEADIPKAETCDPPPYKIELNGSQTELFEEIDLPAMGELDEMAALLPSTPKTTSMTPQNRVALTEILNEKGLRIYPINHDLRNLPKALKGEQRPEMLQMTGISRMVAAQIVIPSKLMDDAIKVARNQLREKELHTELTTRLQHDEYIAIITDRAALAKEAMLELKKLPQVEDEDIRTILQVFSDRVKPLLQEKLDELDPEARPDEQTEARMARDAAHWIAKQQSSLLAEAMHEVIAQQAETVDAGPLPDMMVFPECLPLSTSRKNIYGVFPPNKEELGMVEQHVLLDDRTWLKERAWGLQEGTLLSGQYDSTSALNGEELAFAKAMDRADFIVWWHRNPDRKTYAVGLVRGEHKNRFYPDFIVCLEHYPGDDALIRLIETKQDTKDAARKAKHVPDYYGKVLFLSKDQKRLHWVKEDGSLGKSVDLDDLAEVQDWLRTSRPNQINLSRPR